MNSFQNFHFTQNSQTYHVSNKEASHHQLIQTKIQGKNSSIFSIQQKSQVVEPKLEEKNKRLLWNPSQQMYDQNDSDIEDFDEEEPVESQQIEDEASESEEEEFSCSYYNSSTTPEYLMMPRFQRQNYFDRLNREYLRKMSVENTENLNSNSDCTPVLTKKKPAIKFSNVVYEVPFDKQDQPIAVRYTLEQEIHFTVDGQVMAQETFQESESQAEIQISRYNEENEYFDQFHVLDFDQKVNEQNLSDLSKEKASSEENINSQNDIFRSNIEIPMESVENIQDPIQPEDSLFEEDEALNPFKRDSNGKYLSETSSNDSNSNDSSNECKEADYNEEFESYFALFLQGRKINPNAQQLNQTSH